MKLCREETEKDRLGQGREVAEEWVEVREEAVEEWAETAPEQVQKATVFVQAAAQPPRIRPDSRAIMFDAQSVAYRCKTISDCRAYIDLASTRIDVGLLECFTKLRFWSGLILLSS